MLYPTAAEWTEWGITDECHQFFCLHWTELFDPETPDTWQVRTCNVKTILQELIDASKIAGGFIAYRGVMRSILDETFAIVARDAILNNYYPFVSAYLEPWRKTEIGEKAVPEIERLSQVILGNLKDYWENGIKLVGSLLEKADKGKKKDLYNATMNLAIETVAGGRSPNHVRSRFIATVMTKSEIAFLERVAALFKEFSKPRAKYACVFLPEGIGLRDEEGLPSDITLGKGRPVSPRAAVAPDASTPTRSPPAQDLSIPTELPPEQVAQTTKLTPAFGRFRAIDRPNRLHYVPSRGQGRITGRATPADQFYGRITNDTISLTVQVEATDPETARYMAERRLGELFAAKNLFNVDDRFGIKEQNALVGDEEGKEVLVPHRPRGSPYLGTFDARVLQVEMLFRVQERLRKVSPFDASQLAAAIEYHRLALLAASEEAKLVNLWIALEALCQGGDGSIIERVWSRVSPCVAFDNVKRTLVNLSIFLKKLWTDATDAQFTALFPNSRKTYLAPEDLAKILLLPRGDEKQKQLCHLCREHSLILHRLDRTQSMTLSNPSYVRDNIKYTRQNVEWQIKRIYRARNAIVHTGGSNLLLTQLNQHLHCYLVKTIHSILTDLDRQPMWTIQDSLEHRFQLFDHIVRFFSEKKGHEIALASIMDPEACMKVQTEPFAWLPSAEPEAAAVPNRPANRGERPPKA